MAVTGLALIAFTISHLVGNLLVFSGPDAINSYSAGLRHYPKLLWAARGGLLLAVVAHIWAAVRLTLRKRAARPVTYETHAPIASTYASRTMMWSGPILLAYVIYHLLHFTFGTVHPSFVEGDMYNNVLVGFRQPIVAVAYVVAMTLLSLHVKHGVWSMLQTLGLNSPRSDAMIRRAALAFSLLLATGFMSIPLAVLLGWIS